MAMQPWSYPPERYYYPWYVAEGSLMLTDREIKAMLVNRLNENPRTADSEIEVDVAQGVAVLGGEATSTLAKRAAGDDAWDTPGVVDVSNQLRVVN